MRKHPCGGGGGAKRGSCIFAEPFSHAQAWLKGGRIKEISLLHNVPSSILPRFVFYFVSGVPLGEAQRQSPNYDGPSRVGFGRLMLLKDGGTLRIWLEKQPRGGGNAISTYDNKQYKIYKIVEGVSIHDIVHDIHPSLQCDDLVERQAEGDSALK